MLHHRPTDARHTTREITWNRRLSVLSTSSSIFSPLSSTFSMLSTMMFFTSLTCPAAERCAVSAEGDDVSMLAVHGHQGPSAQRLDRLKCADMW